MSREISDQGLRGKDWNYNLTPVYGVFMMNFDWKSEESGELREDVVLMNPRTRRVFSDKMRMTFFKIPLMDKDAKECHSILDKWLYLFKNMGKMRFMPTSFKDVEVFDKLDVNARVAALDKVERAKYDNSLKSYRDAYAITETARTEGRAEGRTEGKEEMLGENVRNMRKNGFSDIQIANIFSLPLERIEAIR